jgi:hypothetical protein
MIDIQREGTCTGKGAGVLMRFCFVAFSFLMVLAPARILPAVTQHRTPVVLILLRSSTGAEARSLRALIVDAITVEMEARDIDAVSSNDGFTEESEVFSIAEGRKADFAVSGTYMLAGGSVEVHLRWFDLQEKKVFPDASLSASLDLRFDSAVSGFIGQMLDEHQERLVSLPALPPPALPPPASSPQEPAPASKRAPTSTRLLVSGGFAPFLPAGAASYYFGLGYLPSLLVSLLVPTPVGPVGIGIYAGVDYFAAVGLVDTSDNYLIHFGVDFRYELDAGLFRPFFHLVGGPSILVMVTGSQGTLTDLMPFLKSGIGLSALIDYDVYFETPYFLMGFSPSLNMAVRL